MSELATRPCEASVGSPLPARARRRGALVGVAGVRRTVPGVVLVALALAALVLGGCSVIKGTAETASQLQGAGFTNPELSVLNGTEVVLQADQGNSGATPDRAAEIIWKNMPVRVESIAVTVPRNGQTQRYVRSELESTYGARPADLDNPEDSVADFGIWLLVGGSACCLLFVGAIVLIIVLVIRSRRRRRQRQFPYGQQPPFGQQYPYGH